MRWADRIPPRRALLSIAALAVLASTAGAAPCPPGGGALDIIVQPASDARPSTLLVFGTLDEASCESDVLAPGYVFRVDCDRARPDSCRAFASGLQPGRWTHRVLATLGEATGQFQARTRLLLDRSAGTHAIAWPLYRSVHTVLGLGDTLDCTGCLRDAIAAAEAGTKPALVQFAPDVLGSVVLSAALPPLSSGNVTLDAIDTDGQPHTRAIDGNGLSVAALKIVSPRNRVVGLRLFNTGGNSDTVLIDGPEANGNTLEEIDVLGRTLPACMVDDAVGCVLDGECHVPNPQFPVGECGDDGIAVRNFAGSTDPNVIRDSIVRGARDKAIKISEGGAARVERCVITDNADGGLQATLTGTLVATENLVANNRGTNSASGIAANGSTVDGLEPSRLTTGGNLSVGNALRGISVRSLSVAILRDDFLCGNGGAGPGNGVGLAVFDAVGRAATASARGLAVVHNVDAGAVVADTSTADFGNLIAPGENVFAFNGAELPPTPANFRNQTTQPLAAINNHWQHCGEVVPCDTAAVRALDVFAASAESTVAITPANASPLRQPPHITAIEPPFAAAGDLVRLYGTGFDALNGNAAPSCDAVAGANSCRPVRGNCVFIDRQPAEVVAVTPTMLVVRAPFTCVAPVLVQTRTRRSHGFGRAAFCTVPTE